MFFKGRYCGDGSYRCFVGFSLCSSGCIEGLVVTLLAAPDEGSRFSGWSGDPDCVDGKVTMDADVHCVASFYRSPGRLLSLQPCGKVVGGKDGETPAAAGAL